MQFSVIIVHYNSAAMTLRCIGSVYEHTRDTVPELIVVDNDESPDPQITALQDIFPGVQLIRPGRNTGFGAAVNLAAARAGGKYLLLLNPDCCLQGDVLAAFSRFLDRHSALPAGCLGVPLYDEAGQVVHSSGRFPAIGPYLYGKWRSLLSRTGVSAADVAEPLPGREGYVAVDYVTGACLLISKVHFDRAGGFDPGFFMYFEETDLQQRLRRHGLQSYLVSGPAVVHIQGGSKSSDISLRLMYYESMMYYMRRHNSTPAFLLFRYLWKLLDLKTMWLKYAHRDQQAG